MSRLATFLLLASVSILVGLGIVMLASTGAWVRNASGPHALLTQQTTSLMIGIFLFTVGIYFKAQWLRALAPWLFGLGCVLLILCFIPPIGKYVGGGWRWIKFPGMPQFQPSEIAKITSLIALAAWYAAHTAQVRSFVKGFIIPGAIFAIPVVLILLEPDMDTAALLAVAGGSIMFLIGVRLRYMLPIAVLAIAAGVVIVKNNPNRMKRVTAFTKVAEFPQSDKETQDTNRQQWRALLAFGSGGTTGVGLGNGQEKHGYMPEAHTDFILPVIGEELGLVFTLGVVFCYILLGMGGFLVAMQSTDVFSRAMAAGLTLLILLPAMINVAVVTAKMPVAGLPLPFVSYGGTNLIFSLVSVAMIISISRNNVKAASITTTDPLPEPQPMRL